jgi:signal transduction histidine kinase
MGRLSSTALGRLGPVALSIGTILILSLAAWLFMYRTVTEGYRLYSLGIEAQRTLRQIDDALDQEGAAVQAYAATGNQDLLEPYLTVRDRTDAALDRLDPELTRLGVAGTRAPLDQLRISHAAWNTAATELQKARGRNLAMALQANELLDGMRFDIKTLGSQVRAAQDGIRTRAESTVFGSGVALAIAIVLLGTIGLAAQNAARAVQGRLHEQLDARNRALERSNASLADFAYVASHDLQEPLRTVMSYSQLVRQRYSDRLDEDGVEFLRFMSEAAKRMQALIDDLLAYSRVDSASAPRKLVSARDEFEGAVQNLAALIAESGATVEADPLPSVMAHPGHLAIVFQNLISNALKYHAPERPPVIHAGAVRREGRWLFSVADNGIGIEPRYHERIFKMFQRLHGRDEYEGTGIGLALVKRIVELNGGSIWVESTPGRGSTFTFALEEPA